MSKYATIGQAESGPLKLDLLRLVDSRALIQANSGGGKSYLLRGIAEQAADRIQTIILDPEGEFATLREKVDLLLVSREGEIRTDVRAAGTGEG
jgi:DNA helicase HerA-like ATPase